MAIFPLRIDVKDDTDSAKTERNSAFRLRPAVVTSSSTGKGATMTFATPTIGRPRERAAATASDFATAAGRWIGFSVLARLAARFAEHRHKQRMIAELEALDDRHLKDIGIVRGEFWHRVYHRDQYDRMPDAAGRRAAATHQVMTTRLV
jgi:uncharacterized protein YjiS (DUF1127 family)